VFTVNIQGLLCGSKKYPYLHHRGSLEIPRGKGVSEAKTFKGKYEPKLEFPEAWGFKPKKTICGGSMNIFWNNTFFSEALQDFPQ